MLRVFLHIVGTSLLLTAIGVAEPNPQGDQDPLAPPNPAPELKLAKGEFLIAGGLVVKPLSELTAPELVPLKELPEIKAPTTFNRSFESPTKVWRVGGGFLASFDKGEFGGALFFAQHGSKRWTRILDSHIQNLVNIQGDTYLAAGGVAHLQYVGGHAYILSRNNKGEWKVNLIFKTEIGVPAILGTTYTKPDVEAKAEKLIVIGLNPSLAWKPLFGVSMQGAVHYLGETLDPKESEPAGDDQPATKPADKSPVTDQPSAPTSKVVPR